VGKDNSECEHESDANLGENVGVWQGRGEAGEGTGRG
jgi:hypothetical protein